VNCLFRFYLLSWSVGMGSKNRVYAVWRRAGFQLTGSAAMTRKSCPTRRDLFSFVHIGGRVSPKPDQCFRYLPTFDRR